MSRSERIRTAVETSGSVRARPPVVLVIAALDPSGGAGLAADLRTLAACGAWGCPVATAITVQNTIEVRSWRAVDAAQIAAQLDAVAADITVDAVKIGMLGSAEAALAAGEALRAVGAKNVVVDPVFAASVGGSLAWPGLAEAIAGSLMPIATLITPNEAEATVLARAVAGESAPNDREGLAMALAQLTPGAVLLTGGDRPGPEAEDLLVVDGTPALLSLPRIEVDDTHGTGCVLSSAAAAALAAGASIREAVDSARHVVRYALENGFKLGTGSGPADPLGSAFG